MLRPAYTLFLLSPPCSLASALASAANPSIVDAIKQRLDERCEACVGIEKAKSDIAAQKEERKQADQVRAKIEATLRTKVRKMSGGLVDTHIAAGVSIRHTLLLVHARA